MKKTRVPAAVLAALCVATLLIGCGARNYGPVLKANWGLDLPSGCREVYETDTGESFQGDGVRFHVYAVEDAAAVSTALEDWHGRAGENVGSGIEEKADELLAQLSVPEEHLPAYGACRCWFKAGEGDSRDQIILLLEEDTGRLYVIEIFM